ncbi:MAG: hypothetical protein ABIH55_01260 [Nanoarchaeota archaeon]
MKKLNLVLASLVFVILFSSLASAYEININVPSAVNEGEMISFSYTISSNIEETIKFYPLIDCFDSGPDDFLTEETITVNPDNSYTSTHSLVEVNYEWFDNGQCIASINIINPTQETFSESFQVKVADHIEAKTRTYNQDSRSDKVFLVGDIIIIQTEASANPDAKNELFDVRYTSTITSEQGFSQTFEGEAHTMILTEPGSYEVWVTSTSPGFMEDRSPARFVAVSEHVVPDPVRVICNFDLICDSMRRETSSNCPSDCPLTEPVITYDPITAAAQADNNARSMGSPIGLATNEGVMASGAILFVVSVLIIVAIYFLYLKKPLRRKKR